MARHNILTFTAEYCRCIRIPWQIKNDALFIKNAGHYCQVCFNLYNFDFTSVVEMIDEFCDANGVDRFNH